MRTVFYSWQSDLPNSTNRGFIEDCLERAIEELRADDGIRVFEPDRDTQGEPGSPDIADTIFDKIDRCAAFVADVSFINGTQREQPEDGSELHCNCTRLTSNPNVMCEWGRATKSVGIERIITVLNTASGRVEDLPFDLRKRKVETYELRKGEDKKEARKIFVGKLKGALKAILALPQTSVEIQFADGHSKELLGTAVKVYATSHSIDRRHIPDYRVGHGPFGTFDYGAVARANQDYYREKAKYIWWTGLFQPLWLMLRNGGGRLLRNVRFVASLSVSEADGVSILKEKDAPELPKRETNRFELARGINPRIFHEVRSRLNIDEVGGKPRIELFFGDVQPKAHVLSDVFYLGSKFSRTIELSGLIYADELSEPVPVTLSIEKIVSDNVLSMKELETPLSEETGAK